MLYRLLAALFVGADFALVSPEAVICRVLLLDELIIIEVGGEEWLLLGRVTAFCDLSEGGSEFIFAIFSGNISAIPWNLGSAVNLAHQNIITSTMWLIIGR